MREGVLQIASVSNKEDLPGIAVVYKETERLLTVVLDGKRKDGKLAGIKWYQGRDGASAMAVYIQGCERPHGGIYIDAILHQILNALGVVCMIMGNDTPNDMVQPEVDSLLYFLETNPSLNDQSLGFVVKNIAVASAAGSYYLEFH